MIFGILIGVNTPSQENIISGVVRDAGSFEIINNARVAIEGTTLETFTDEEGKFKISLPDHTAGAVIFTINKSDYLPQRIPVNFVPGRTIDLEILLQPDLVIDQLFSGAISLSDAQLLDDENNADNVAGLLQASRDVFLNAAAFDFSQTFFRPRGLDSEHGKLYINGIEMNKIFNARPLWSNWGGLNDVQRNQVFSMGMVPAEVGFGGLAGSTNIVMRASKYGKGGRLSYALANRTYTGRVMATYNSGELNGGWAYSFSLSRRFAKEVYIEGTLYDANAFFVSVEKRIDPYHSINFTTFYTPNIRGKSSPTTQEVYNIKGQRYNSYWGFQDGELRNSRIKEVKEPVIMLNHFWTLSEKTQLNTNVAYQFGRISNTRIDYGGTRLVIQPDDQESYVGGGANPDPTYFHKLPSYFLRNSQNPNYEGAYRARELLVENGQLNWQHLYEANLISKNNGDNSVYVLAEDRNDDRQFTANTILNTSFNTKLNLTSKLTFSRLISENFANIRDLLGGDGYLDIDFFAQADQGHNLGDRAQSDLLNRNRIVGVGDRFKYNYELHAQVVEGFSNLHFKTKMADYYLAGNISNRIYWRNGIFKNGSHPDNSLGKSGELNFTDFGIKAGGVYRITGRHLLDFNAGYLTNPPTMRSSFSNSRQNNSIVKDLTSERLLAADVGYIFRTPSFRTRFTGYITQVSKGTELSFYYADGLSEQGRENTNAFVQEILTGISKRHLGIEAGIDYQITSTIKVKGVAAIGQYIYTSDPNLYLTSDSFISPIDYGKASLKNYHLPGGPQRAAQIGFEYRDPDYWWVGTTVNFFSHAFADINTLTRTSNFLTDVDGLPILNYDENIARRLLKQERFDSYYLVNVIGGKSWRIKSNYIGFFVSLNNIFDVVYKSGGFEQSRNSNYRTLKQDRERDLPLFGNKYWYGTRASYYANVYFRF